MQVERYVTTFMWVVSLFLALSYAAFETDASPVAVLGGWCAYGIICAISPRMSARFARSRVSSRGYDRPAAALLFMIALLLDSGGWFFLIPFALSGVIIAVTIHAEFERGGES